MTDQCDECKAALEHERKLFKGCEQKHHELVIENSRLRSALAEAVSHRRNGRTLQRLREEWGIDA